SPTTTIPAKRPWTKGISTGRSLITFWTTRRWTSRRNVNRYMPFCVDGESLTVKKSIGCTYEVGKPIHLRLANVARQASRVDRRLPRFLEYGYQTLFER